MPSLGADMESGFLREWRVKKGDPVKRGDIIAEVETQKGIIEIEVFDEGVVGDLLLRMDEKVPVGALMAYILSPGEVANEQEVQREAKEKAVIIPETKKEGGKTAVPAAAHRIKASPLARKIAEQKGIDLSTLKGSGPEGAIVRADVEHVVSARPNGHPVAAPSPVQKSAAESIRMAVAAAMSRSNREVPHYFLQTKADMRHALAWLAELNRQRSVADRLLPAALLIKAVAKALEEVPDLNAWWENGLQLKEEIHVGFVVALRGGGIIVPAIHDAGKKSLDDVMKALSDIIPRARALKLRSSELADSTITISSLGDGGVETVFGIIYPPQVALVAFGGITEEPWAENGMLGIRPVLTVGLSADHRATDGNTGSLFLTAVKNYLSKPELL